VTPTRVPDAERAELVFDLMQGSADCALPCWWNIRPGVTTRAEAEAILRPLGPIQFFEHEIHFELFFPERLRAADVLPWLTVRSQNYGYGGTPVTPNGEPRRFMAFWEQYQPGPLLQRLGPPTRVWLRTRATSVGPHSADYTAYNLALAYDEAGFFINYSGFRELPVRDTIEICPNRGDWILILVVLKDRGFGDSLERLADQNLPMSAYLSLEQSTSWTIERFYQTYVQAGSPTCMTTPLSIWP
jgi:hypothetical protein